MFRAVSAIEYSMAKTDLLSSKYDDEKIYFLK